MNRPLTNVTAAIEGSVPGVMTTSLNGQPGSGPQMRVRVLVPLMLLQNRCWWLTVFRMLGVSLILTRMMLKVSLF